MTGGVWVASYVLLWVAVLVLGFAVVVLLRQIGVLHARLRPMGVHHANEGPERGAPAPIVGAAGVAGYRSPVTLVAFTSPTCELCRTLVPALHRIEDEYPEVTISVVEHSPATVEVFGAFNVHSTPYVVAVDGQGIVRGGGVANTLEQVEVLVEATLHPVPGSSATRSSATRSSAAGSSAAGSSAARSSPVGRA